MLVYMYIKSIKSETINTTKKKKKNRNMLLISQCSIRKEALLQRTFHWGCLCNMHCIVETFKVTVNGDP